MAARAAKSDAPELVVTYDNLADLAPRYAEGAQGMVTPTGALHLCFYSEYFRPARELRAKPQEADEPNTAQYKPPEPYQPDADGAVHVVRRIETSVILTERVLAALIPWLEQRLSDMRAGTPQRMPAVQR